MSGKETSAKKTLFSQGERSMKNIIEDSSSYLLLMLVFRINSFSMIKEKLGRSEREIGLFIKTNQDSSIRRKVTRKKEGKICHFA